mmetsp:Transcript_20655/g.54801  ORF Transcript_20655/g.54801 Transcript_20655/m.54801 type:complete len:235 (-) Transcript_20655:29-733(-)
MAMANVVGLRSFQCSVCSSVYTTPEIGTEYTPARPAPVPQATRMLRCSASMPMASAKCPAYIADISRGAASRPTEPPRATTMSCNIALSQVTAIGIFWPLMLSFTGTKAGSLPRRVSQQIAPKIPAKVTEVMRRHGGAASEISRKEPCACPKPRIWTLRINSLTNMLIRPHPTPCSTAATARRHARNTRHPHPAPLAPTTGAAASVSSNSIARVRLSGGSIAARQPRPCLPAPY